MDVWTFRDRLADLESMKDKVDDRRKELDKIWQDEQAARKLLDTLEIRASEVELVITSLNTNLENAKSKFAEDVEAERVQDVKLAKNQSTLPFMNEAEIKALYNILVVEGQGAWITKTNNDASPASQYSIMDMPKNVKDMLRARYANNKIACIKDVRTALDMGLKEAKETVELFIP